jgi:hypothetical protein
MVAAALTVWILFAVWIVAPLLHLPPLIARVAAVMLCTEIVALLLWSYGSEGCNERTCAPLAQAFGIAARTDIPILAAAFVGFAGYVAVRRLDALGPSIEAEGRIEQARERVR